MGLMRGVRGVGTDGGGERDGGVAIATGEAEEDLEQVIGVGKEGAGEVSTVGWRAGSG